MISLLVKDVSPHVQKIQILEMTLANKLIFFGASFPVRNHWKNVFLWWVGAFNSRNCFF